MSLLEISQIIFNLVASLAVIITTAVIVFIAYDIIIFLKLIKKFLADVGKESSEIYRKIDNFLQGILTMSFITKFFQKKNKKSKD